MFENWDHDNVQVFRDPLQISLAHIYTLKCNFIFQKTPLSGKFRPLLSEKQF